MTDDLELYIDPNYTQRGLPVVTYQRPRCPHCGSVKITTRRSKSQGDESVFRYSTCKECKENFGVIAE